MQYSKTVELDPLFALKRKFLDKSNGACQLPSRAMEAIELATNPDCSLYEFVLAIEQDVDLAIQILTLANSPLFVGNTPVASLSQAAVRLGMRRCRNLILTGCIRRMTKKLSLAAEWASDLLNRHALMTATASTLINEQFDLGYHGEEYAAGMLHDFGRLALAVATEKDFSEFDDLSFVESDDVLQRENEYLGTNHCEFAANLFESVSFPAELIEVVRWHHHDLDSIEIEHPLLVSLIRAADHFAGFLQREEAIEDYPVDQNKGLMELAELQSDDTLIPNFAEQIDTFVDRIHQMVQIDGSN